MTTAKIMGFQVTTSAQAISVGMIAATNGLWDEAKQANEVYKILKNQGK